MKETVIFFFVLTLLALGVTGVFSIILSARGLWTRRSLARNNGANK